MQHTQIMYPDPQLKLPYTEGCSPERHGTIQGMLHVRILAPSKRGAKTWQDAARRVKSMGKRLGEDCTTVAEGILTFNMDKFLSLCPTGDTEYVRNKMPKSLLEAANILEEHQATRQRRPFQSRYRYSDGQPELHTENRWDNSPRQVPFQGADTIGNKPRPTPQESSGAANQGQKQGEHNPFVPTCFLCGKKGHKRPDCPTKWKVGLVRNSQQHDPIVQDTVVSNRDAVCLVVVPVRQQCLYAPGKIGNVECQMRVDTGAGQTIVDAKLVKPSEYLGTHMTLTMADGSTILSPLALVWITFGNYQIHHVVAVAEEAPKKLF